MERVGSVARRPGRAPARGLPRSLPGARGGLRLHAIVVFRPDPEDFDGYAGEFVILTDPEDDTGQEWRADLTEAGPQRLRPW